ncbi:MAG: class I SAM-dependent methyltransferase [Bryobacteraceae bacterium]|jgi:ubiquinone/menaquinone biosynthesis C-methylase UbiE
MTKISVRGCPICANQSVELLHSQQFALSDSHPLAGGYDVVACDACGFVYADTESPQSAYDALYHDASKYQDARTSTGGGESVWDADRLAQTAQTVSTVLPNKNGRILDVGCANGGLLEALRALGHSSLEGLDPSPACVANTRRRGFDAWTGSLSRIPENLGPFDVVILSHVLEHVRDLGGALTGLNGILHENSIVYFEVPDATRYGDFLNAPFQDFNTEHINHFSGTCLVNLARRFGFTPIVPTTAKVVKSSADTLYPAVFGIYQVTDAATGTLTKDDFLKERIREYCAASSALMQSINRHLSSELETCGEVVLWGTGQLAMKLLNEEPLRKAHIRACVDGNPLNRGKQLRGIPILSPAELKDGECPIVITSTLHETAIRRDMQALGLTNRIISLRHAFAAQARL